MKLFILISYCILILYIPCLSQIKVSPDEWSYVSDTSVFDGTSQVAFIVGISDDIYVRTPILAVNEQNNDSIQVYLVYFPSGICGNAKALLNFDGQRDIIQSLSSTYDFKNRRYVLIFDSSLTLDEFLGKLKYNKTLYIRLSSRCFDIDVSFCLNGAKEKLKILSEN